MTVDIARGPIRGTSRSIHLVDLPGTYSLAAHSPDEMIVLDALHGRLPRQQPPEAIVAVIDAANPFRNCYLLTQLLEIDRPLVVALNMVDLAEARGIRVDADKLARRLGVPVVPIVATQPKTVAPLAAAIERALDAAPPQYDTGLPTTLQQEVSRLRAQTDGEQALSRAEALRILLDRDGSAEQAFARRGGDLAVVGAARQRLRHDGDPAAAEVRARYACLNRLLEGVVERHAAPGDSWSERLDRVLTHRFAGAAALLAVLYAMFYAIYRGAQPLMEGVDALLGGAGMLAARALPGGFVESLVVDGLIGGVGGVLTFLPQILILFLFIAILEDCGYLSRAAFMVDRLMRPFGLSGHSFIPLLSSFACAVPAIMGTRAIADRRERYITILILPFMSCSARLPVYVLLIGAFVPATTWLGGWLRLDALVMLAMYLVGILFAIPIALLLRRTVFTGPPSGFLLELPSYKWPRLRTMYQRVYLAGRSFLVRAGTVILLVNLVVWALGYFPRDTDQRQVLEAARTEHDWSAARFEAELAAARLRDSYLGRMGRAIEPVIEPIGWDWRIGVGVVASFPAREVIIATLGTIANLGADRAAEPVPLEQAIQRMKWEDGRPLFTLPVALSIMIFFALCAQCSATLVTVGREMGSWLWPVILFVGMTSLAYVAAWVTAAVGRALLP